MSQNYQGPTFTVSALASSTQALYSMPGVTPGRTTVHLRVVPDAQEGNAAVLSLMLATLDSLGKTPSNVQQAQKWSEDLSQKLRQNGFPLGQVLMTREDWNNAQTYGQYVFTVFPGRITQITVKNTSRVKDIKLKKIITHALCGTDTMVAAHACLLKTSSLERATQLLQDIPGVAMAGAPRFSAGKIVGETEVEFEIQAKGRPVSGGLVADNGGVAATGRTRLGVSVSGNNLFHAGDSYALTLMDTQKGTLTGSVSASAPIGNGGLRLAGQVTRSQYAINSITPIVGVSTVVQGGIQYPFARGLDRNVWGNLWFLHNSSSVNLTDYGQSTHSTINSVQFSVQADNGDRAKQMRSNRWGINASLTAGHNSNNDPNDAVVKRGGNYAKLNASAFGSYGLNQSGNLFMTGQISGQFAGRNLDSSEQMALGGPSAVRGYRSDEGSVDEGAVVNMGIYQRIPITTGHQVQLGSFVDLAYGRVNHSPWSGWDASYVGVPNVSNNRELYSYGLSVDWLTPFGASLSAAVARPFSFSSPSWVDPGQKPTQYWLTLGVSQ